MDLEDFFTPWREPTEGEEQESVTAILQLQVAVAEAEEAGVDARRRCERGVYNDD